MPPEERAILAAIIADPDDDTARLAYADWLDENADALPPRRRASARARAGLIRNQIARANLIFGAPGFDEKDNALQARYSALATKENYAAWESELEGVTAARGTHFSPSRGLFGKVACTAKYFVEHGAALFDAAPITSVRLKKFTVSNVKSLAACPHFARVRTLKLYAVETPLRAILSLLDRVPLDHLRGLAFDNWLANHGFTDQADSLAGHVAASAKLAGVRRLSFYAAGVGEEGGRALAASPHLEKLEVLDLRGNARLGGAKAALRKRFGKRVWLTYDDLRGLPLGYQDGE